jgi:hypothetical protein
VSEFTHFISDYLSNHPEIVADQRVGWSIYLNKRVDPATQEEARQDAAPDDAYGFHVSVWARDAKH